MKIKVSTDFTMTPGGRFKNQGAYSGEEFRETLLVDSYNKSIESNENLIVDLDDCRRAFPPSFLDEAFGGLAKVIKDKDIESRIEIISYDEPKLIQDIKNIIKKNMEHL